ncbi:MAG: hypothetical protein HGN29_07815 [Asgard group archaeon]|nr:hypothetical protein [Asgard group archaeon]
MSNLSFFYPDDSEAFSSQGKTTIILTYILAVLGMGIGTFLLIISRGSSYLPDGEIDDLPDFDPLFKLVGTIFLILAIISLAANLLFINKKKSGWFLLTSIYSAGSALTIYVLYLGIRVLIENRLFALPYPLILLLAVGVVGIYTLFHKNTLGLFFLQILSKVE